MTSICTAIDEVDGDEPETRHTSMMKMNMTSLHQTAFDEWLDEQEFLELVTSNSSIKRDGVLQSSPFFSFT